MKIYYDYQILKMQKYGGISRYYFDLISNINDQNLACAVIRCYKFASEYFESYFEKKSTNVRMKICSKFQIAINRFLVYRELKKDYDIVHPTYYNPYILKYLKKNQKLVITVYDMIHEKFPELLNDKALIERKKKMIYAADCIIAISKNTKKDILYYYPDINPNKIKVIYLATDFKSVYQKNVTLPEKYVLFVGDREKYKNFIYFSKAMVPILKRYEDLKVVCAGGRDFSNDEIRLFGKLKGRYIKILADNDTLCMAYANAQCFIFPSLYEGFGIPTLEAFSCGCPVVLSNTSSMPEVGGNAAVYFNPEDIEDMTDKIGSVLQDDEMRIKMIKKGKEQLNKFSWKEIARQTVECYASVVNDSL